MTIDVVAELDRRISTKLGEIGQLSHKVSEASNRLRRELRNRAMTGHSAAAISREFVEGISGLMPELERLHAEVARLESKLVNERVKAYAGGAKNG